MTLGHEHTAIPGVARQRHKLGKVGKRLGRDADIDFGTRGLLGHLNRIALVEQQADPRIFIGEALEHRRQDVTRLGVRRRDRQRADILCLELRADAL